MKHKKQILMLTVKFTENGKPYHYLYRGNKIPRVGDLASVTTTHNRSIDLPILAVSTAVLKSGICYKFVNVIEV